MSLKVSMVVEGFHLWPDSDESTRTAIDAIMQARAEAVQSAESDSL